MNARIALFFVTLMAFALFAAANPVPDAAAPAKRQLKQFDIRNAGPPSRVGKRQSYVHLFPLPPRCC